MSRDDLAGLAARDAIVDQPPPKPGKGDIWRLVIQDMEARRKVGIARYGVPLQTGNGRDALVDAYQEAQDLCVYLRQEIEERKNMLREVLRRTDRGLDFRSGKQVRAEVLAMLLELGEDA